MVGPDALNKRTASQASDSSGSSGSSDLVFPASPPPSRPHRVPLGETTTNHDSIRQTPRKKVKADAIPPCSVPASSNGTTTASSSKLTATPSRSRRAGLGRPSPSPATSRSSLFRPFKSPLVRRDGGAGVPSTTSTSSASKLDAATRPSRVDPVTSPTRPPASSISSNVRQSSRHKRSERNDLEDRLRLLKQADKIMRDRSLEVLPELIEKWREAGKMAAQDLWNLTGAAEAGQEAFSISSRPFDSDDHHGYQDAAQQRRHEQEEEADSPPTRRTEVNNSPPPSPRTAFLLRRTVSEGTKEQTAALRAVEDDEGREHSSSRPDSPLPAASDLFASAMRGSKVKIYDQKRTRSGRSIADKEEEDSQKGIEQKWNVGRMLDLIGVDKSTLRWNTNEEEFQ